MARQLPGSLPRCTPFCRMKPLEFLRFDSGGSTRLRLEPVRSLKLAWRFVTSLGIRTTRAKMQSLPSDSIDDKATIQGLKIISRNLNRMSLAPCNLPPPLDSPFRLICACFSALSLSLIFESHWHRQLQGSATAIRSSGPCVSRLVRRALFMKELPSRCFVKLWESAADRDPVAGLYPSTVM